jgi:hypothetical protein
MRKLAHTAAEDLLKLIRFERARLPDLVMGGCNSPAARGGPDAT